MSFWWYLFWRLACMSHTYAFSCTGFNFRIGTPICCFIRFSFSMYSCYRKASENPFLLRGGGGGCCCCCCCCCCGIVSCKKLICFWMACMGCTCCTCCTGCTGCTGCTCCMGFTKCSGCTGFTGITGFTDVLFAAACIRLVSNFNACLIWFRFSQQLLQSQPLSM